MNNYNIFSFLPLFFSFSFFSLSFFFFLYCISHLNCICRDNATSQQHSLHSHISNQHFQYYSPSTAFFKLQAVFSPLLIQLHSTHSIPLPHYLLLTLSTYFTIPFPQATNIHHSSPCILATLSTMILPLKSPV